MVAGLQRTGERHETLDPYSTPGKQTRSARHRSRSRHDEWLTRADRCAAKDYLLAAVALLLQSHVPCPPLEWVHVPLISPFFVTVPVMLAGPP